jgi:hypothetical protein
MYICISRATNALRNVSKKNTHTYVCVCVCARAQFVVDTLGFPP